MRQKWIIFAAIILALAGSLAGCGRNSSGSAEPPEKTTFAIASTTDSVLAQVALAKGYFRDEGLEVTPILHPYGKPALQDVLDGKADFATVAETPFMFAILNGAKIAVLSTIQSSQRGNSIVAREDRGIHTINDLRGKRIAATLGTTSDYYLDVILSVNGISRNEVNVVNMQAEKMPAALSSGEIDAVSTFTTYVNSARKMLGDNGIVFYDDIVYTFTFNIVATQSFIRENPKKVEKLLRALIRAEEYTRQKPTEAQMIVADFSKVDIMTVREIWHDHRFAVVLDQALLLALEDESLWAIKGRHTQATSMPNYLNHIYLDGLRAVKPSAERILK